MTWYLPLLRAIPAIAFAAVVTFSQDHSSSVGLIALGGYGIAGGAVLVWSGVRASGVERVVLIVQGGILAVAGIIAFATTGGGLPYLVFLLSSVAALTGLLELYLGLRGGPLRRDRMFVGGITVLLAVAVLLVPPGFQQQLGGIEGVAGVLTASTIVVGALGAYFAVIGVYLVIAAFSLKWAPADGAAVQTR